MDCRRDDHETAAGQKVEHCPPLLVVRAPVGRAESRLRAAVAVSESDQWIDAFADGDVAHLHLFRGIVNSGGEMTTTVLRNGHIVDAVQDRAVIQAHVVASWAARRRHRPTGARRARRDVTIRASGPGAQQGDGIRLLANVGAGIAVSP
jgi:hypothetical protein